jgi:hypothetical protein
LRRIVPTCPNPDQTLRDDIPHATLNVHRQELWRKDFPLMASLRPKEPTPFDSSRSVTSPKAAKRCTCASARPTVHSPQHQDRQHRHRLRSSNRTISLSNQLPIYKLIFFYQHHINARAAPPGPGPASWPVPQSRRQAAPATRAPSGPPFDFWEGP